MSYYYLLNPKFFLDPGPLIEQIDAEKKRRTEELQEKLADYQEILSDLKEVQSAEVADVELRAREGALQRERIETAKKILEMQEEEDALMVLLLH